MCFVLCQVVHLVGDTEVAQLLQHAGLPRLGRFERQRVVQVLLVRAVAEHDPHQRMLDVIHVGGAGCSLTVNVFEAGQHRVNNRLALHWRHALEVRSFVDDLRPDLPLVVVDRGAAHRCVHADCRSAQARER